MFVVSHLSFCFLASLLFDDGDGDDDDVCFCMFQAIAFDNINYIPLRQSMQMKCVRVPKSVHTLFGSNVNSARRTNDGGANVNVHAHSHTRTHTYTYTHIIWKE